MPEVVEPDIGQPGSPQQRLPVLVVEVVAPERSASPRAEHEIPGVPCVPCGSTFSLLGLPMPLEGIYGPRREPDAAAAALRLGLGKAGTALRQGQGSPHPHGPRLEVHVLPPQ